MIICCTVIGSEVKIFSESVIVYCPVPSSPRILHVLGRNGTAVKIRWAAPERKNGKLLGYQLYVLYNERKSSVNISGGDTNAYQITGLSELLFS